MENNFENIYEEQKKLQVFLESMITEENSLEKKEELTKATIIHLITEAIEVLDNINWKMHKKTRKDVDEKAILEESIDIFKYLMNIWIIWGYNPQQIFEEFMKKTEINYDRKRNNY